MGNDIGRQYFSQPQKVITNTIRGKKLAIDGSLYIYKYCAVYRDASGNMFTSKNGEVTAHIYGLVRFITQLLKLNITPHFVFEGQCAKLKHSEIMRRKELKVKAKEKLAIALSTSVKSYALIKRLKQQTFSITSQIKESARRLLNLAGITNYSAEYQGEKCCCDLVIDGTCDYAVSDDWDACFYGGTIIRNLQIEDGEGTEAVVRGQIVDVCKLAEINRFTQKDLITMACIAGCDYVRGLPGYGPKKAPGLITKPQFYTSEFYKANVLPIIDFIIAPSEYVVVHPRAHKLALYDWLTESMGINPNAAYQLCKTIVDRY